MMQLRDSKFNYVIYDLIPFLKMRDEKEDNPYLEILREALSKREDEALEKGLCSACNHTEWNKLILKLKRYETGHEKLCTILNDILVNN